LFSISVETNFSASHSLDLPDGGKEPLHQHNWIVCTKVASDKLNNIGLVMDFRILKAIVDNIVVEFSDMVLDKIDYFKQNGSSAEMVAKYVFEKLEPKLPASVKLKHIKVIEEPGCSAKFSK